MAEGNIPAISLPQATYRYGLVVKVQLFCWSSELPARSFVPVLRTPLYLVFLASRIVFAPKGFSVALSPSELRLTTTSAIRVWVPSGLTLKTLNVVALTVSVLIFSEKVAVRLVPRATFVARLSGAVPITAGLVVSTLTVVALEDAEVLLAA